MPIFYPSVEDFTGDETNYRSLAGSTTDPTTGLPVPNPTLRVTEDCQNRTINPFGIPSGETQDAVMPYGVNNTQFGAALPILSVTSDGTATVTVTCSAVHNLKTNDQVSVEGVNFPYAGGMYSVTVTTATAFTYMTYGANPSGSLLTPTTRIVTCLIGLPRGYTP